MFWRDRVARQMITRLGERLAIPLGAHDIHRLMIADHSPHMIVIQKMRKEEAVADPPSNPYLRLESLTPPLELFLGR
jgi:hypothetical protein